MKTRFQILVLTLIILFTNCKKDTQTNDKIAFVSIEKTVTDYLIQRESPKDGSISLTSFKPSWLKGEEKKKFHQIMFDAAFYQNKDKKTSYEAGSLAIDDIITPFLNNTSSIGYNLQSLNISDSSIIKKMVAVFGKKIKISVTPTNTANVTFSTTFPTLIKVNEVSSDFYAPSEIDLQSPIVDNYYVNPIVPNQISWTPDLNNPSQTVFIGVLDEGTFANSSNPNISPVTSLIYFSEQPDNGSFILTPQILSLLTSGGRASVFIARANYIIYIDPVTHNQILIDAMTYATSGPILVQ